MVEEPKETVILVHGTFAAPRRGKTQWYQPCDDASANGFIARLNAALERRGSAARCWAHRSGEDSGFHWSGENSWIARTHAATALAAYVANLREKGWRCHIVAHSHGGNVVCEALPQIVTAQEPSSPLGNIVTLGTPFMDVMSAILQRAQRKARILETSTRMSSALFTLMFLIYIISSIVLSVLIGGVYGLVLFGILGVINSSRIGRLISNLERLLGSGSTEEKTKSDDAQALYSVLALGSVKDEAWQILHHLQNINDPMCIRSNLAKYIYSALRAHILLDEQVARIGGAKSYRDVDQYDKAMLALRGVDTGQERGHPTARAAIR